MLLAWSRARLWCFWPGCGLGLWLRLRLRLRAPSLFLVLLAWRRWLLWTVVVGAVSVAAALGFFLLLATFAFVAAVVVHDPHMLQEADTSCRTHEYQLLNSDDLWYNLVVYIHIKKMGALAKMLSDCIPLCADTWCTLCDIHAKVLQSFLVLVNLRRTASMSLSISVMRVTKGYRYMQARRQCK